MSPDNSFKERNRASSRRMRNLVASLSNEELSLPVGKSWTVASTFAHIAFWDLRVMHVLDATERDGKLNAPQIDISLNDIALPLWKSVMPRDAAQLAIEVAESLDVRLEKYSPLLLEKVIAHNERWVLRDLHRNAHLDVIEAALKR
jgi:hypothetical protein